MSDKYPSVLRQAYSDTERCLGFLWYYVLGVFLMALCGVGGWLLTPSNASTFRQVVTSAVAGVVGGIGLVLVTYLTMLLVAPYKQRNKALSEREQARKQAALSDKALKQVRAEIQRQSGYKLVDIPNILSEMWQLAHNLTTEKRRTEPNSSAMWAVAMELLDIEDDKDPLMSLSKYDTKTKVAHMVRVFRMRMGIKKGGTKVDLVVRRVIRATNRQNVGVNLSANEQYKVLVSKLEPYRVHISGIKLDNSIDSYLLHMEGLCDIQLLSFHGQTGKNLHKFPREMRDVLEELENLVSGQMRRELIAVSLPLERWLAGKTD